MDVIPILRKMRIPPRLLMKRQDRPRRTKTNDERVMTTKTSFSVLIVGILAWALSACGGIGSSLISPADVLGLEGKDSTVVLLDVRTPEEFTSETGHLARALLIPVQELDNRLGELTGYRDRTIIVYCRTGHRSTRATEILQSHGFKAMNMEGGITRWQAEHFPTVQENR
jgi:rhodanese-related sulfurtransferase